MKLDHLKPVQRHYYLKDNNTVCPCCKRNKSLTHFYIKESNILNDICKTCEKKRKKHELKMAFISALKEMNLTLDDI